MAGRGKPPKPAAQRVNHHSPRRGELEVRPDVGWQHGKAPDCPEGMMPASVLAWSTWMGSWFAAHWTPDDVPGLRQIVRLYDQVERGEFQRSSELRLQMDTYGITPKGQQDRRWVKPKAEEPKAKPAPSGPSARDRLRVVGE